MRLASASSAWCAYHRKHYDDLVRRDQVARPADLLDTGMVVENRTGLLQLLGGAFVPAPEELSRLYYFGELDDAGRIPVMLPASRMRDYLERLRPVLAKAGAA